MFDNDRLLAISSELRGGRPDFGGAFSLPVSGLKAAARMAMVKPGDNKVVKSLKEAIRLARLEDGMTISFHHHLRDGDEVLNLVMAVIAEMGIGDLTVAASSIFPVHAPLCEHIRSGVVTGIETNYVVGPVADAISRGELPKTAILRSHGGRARAIEAGDLRIHVAFIAAPAADSYGNVNGVDGPSACGSLGYAVADAQYADHVIAITDHLVPYPLTPISIPQSLVDWVVPVDRIGNPALIVSGTTRITKDPVGLLIAKMAADVADAVGLIQDGLSLQTGAGGISLAVAAFLKEKMQTRKVVGSFGLGGITGYFVDMLESGLFRALLDTQCFDLRAVKSLKNNPRHQEIDASIYANPHNKGAVVNNLDVMVLGATEIDVDFNVNVTTGSSGSIMGGSGGHADTAAGSKLAMVVTTATRSRLPIIRDRVTTITTPGETVDILVTELGVSVNPQRADLLERLKATGLPLIAINQLKDQVEARTGRPDPVTHGDRVVALVEYRDGSLIDVIYQVK